MAAPRNSRSTDLPAALASFLAPRLSAVATVDGLRFCVGLSGGRDSVALLHAVAALRATAGNLHVSALHVHHGLSPQADRWTAFCEDFCCTLNVPLKVVRVGVDTSSEEGIEAAARRARYAAFAACDADVLALAHHRDDQAETLLLNLLRGAGVHGLAAMPPERPLGKGRPILVRPLLDVSRVTIDAYLQVHGLTWVDDESNDDHRLRRNFLRHEILPRFAECFPGGTTALARTAGHMQQAAALADEIAAQDRIAATSENGTLRLAPFFALPATRRANLLRHELRLAGARMPDTRHFDEILRQLAEAGSAARPRLRVDGVELHVHRGELLLVPALLQPLQALPWRGEKSLPWASGIVGFDTAVGQGVSRARLFVSELALRPREGGERFQRSQGTPRRALKKVLQDADMPAWQRERLPLLWCGDALVWVGGVGVDAAWQAGPAEVGVLPVWRSA